MAALLLRTRLSIESFISPLLFEWHNDCHSPLACGVLLLERYGTLCSVTYYKSARHHERQGRDCAVGVVHSHHALGAAPGLGGRRWPSASWCSPHHARLSRSPPWPIVAGSPFPSLLVALHKSRSESIGPLCAPSSRWCPHNEKQTEYKGVPWFPTRCRE